MSERTPDANHIAVLTESRHFQRRLQTVWSGGGFLGHLFPTNLKRYKLLYLNEIEHECAMAQFEVYQGTRAFLLKGHHYCPNVAGCN